jgi:hypothetical protein
MTMAEDVSDWLADQHGRRIDRDFPAADIEGQLQAIEVRFDGLEGGGLKVAVVPGGIEAGAAELGGDEFGGDVEAFGGGGAAFKGVGGQEGNIGLEIVGGDAQGGGGLREGKGGGEDGREGSRCQSETCAPI